MSNDFLAIDGLSLEEHFKKNLNSSGVFTDQNFAGSNLSIINKQFAYIFSILLYNLNQNIHGGLYSETEIYENMSRILKSISYKPLGYQTAFVSSIISATNTIGKGTHIIPRYSYVQMGGIKYSLLDDIVFSKNDSNEIVISDDVILYQGDFREYHIPKTQGFSNERYIIPVNDSAYIDHNTISVYVKRNNKWEKWQPTVSLFLNKGDEKVYDIRFNENKKYEISFGNNVNGSKLNANEEIVVFYLKSDGTKGEIAANTFKRRFISPFKSKNFSSILSDTTTSANIPQTGIIVTNTCPSSTFQNIETVDEMRANAPNLFNSQFRLITANDYDIFIRSNFGNLVHDVKILNNSDYVSEYLQYFYDMGLNEAELDSRSLYNQLNFADSCNFNNIYGFIVPKYNSGINYVPPSQKSLIINTIKSEKTLTADFIVADPVYIYVDLVLNDIVKETPEDSLYTVLTIYKNRNSRKNSIDLKNEVAKIIEDYFTPTNLKLGQTIDILSLTNSILGISDVDKITTDNILTGSSKQGIQFLTWNPSFVETSALPISSNTPLLSFQYPYFPNLAEIKNRIIIK